MNQQFTSRGDFSQALIAAMAEHELYINQVNLDSAGYQRFRSIGTCRTKCCEYRIFENYLGAHFKCFRRGIDRFWFADGRKPTYQERIIMAEEREKAMRSRMLLYAEKAARCEAFFNRLPMPNPLHPYCQRKRILPFCARKARSMLVLPIRDVDHNIQSLQFIKKNGFKQFKTGATTREGMIWLCEYLPLDYSGVIRICEGWATGCTILDITRSPVICALNAYNIAGVAIALRRKYQHANIKICADNDQWGQQNVGIEQAREGCLQTGATLHYPDFGIDEASAKPTDFNDLFNLCGAEITKRQLIRIRE